MRFQKTIKRTIRGDKLMKVFSIQFTDKELTELENVLDQHVYAEAIENKGSEGTIGTIHNRILDVHYQNSDGLVPVQEATHRLSLIHI